MNVVSRADAYFLPVSTLLFLFSGFYKGLIPSPIDLTVAAAALVCLSLLLNRRFLTGFLALPVLLVVAINFWLALRLYPDFDPWGIRKLSESVAFGTPALAAGFVLSRDETQRSVFLKLLAYPAISAAIFVIFQTLEHPLFFSPLLGAGYQLTGLFFAFAMIASAVLANPYTLAFSVIGALVCGNITGSLFGGIAVIAVWWCKPALRDIAKQIAAVLIVVGAYTVTVAPPLAVERLLIVAFNFEPPEPGSGYIPGLLKNIAPTQAQLEQISEGSTARLDIWKSAIDGIKEKPLLGWGYGNYDYGTATMAHNVFLGLQTEAGVVASILLLALLSLLLWCGFSAAKPFALGCFILATADMMISAYWGGRLSMFAFGLVAGTAGSSWASSPQLPNEPRYCRQSPR